MRKVDKLGRIVIPMNLREKYGLTEGKDIEFLDVGEGVTVRAASPFCKICGGTVLDGARLPLCETCVSEVLKEHNESS